MFRPLAHNIQAHLFCLIMPATIAGDESRPASNLVAGRLLANVAAATALSPLQTAGKDCF
jgi:hypothetical protein